MKNRLRLISASIFFAIIILLPILTLFSHKESFSATENRNLASKPKATTSSIFDKSFMKNYESYISDHFIGRINWIQTKVDTELTIGKKEINGIYITKNRLLEKLPDPDYNEVDKATTAINEFAEQKGLPVYVLVAPTSSGIYADTLPKNAPQIDQKAFIDYVYSSLSPTITPIDVYSSLYTIRNDEYIYYNNDHHWTTLGAYYAYNVAIQKLGFSAISYDKFDIEHASNDFKGTFYSKSLYDKIPMDSVDIYQYNEASNNITDVTITTGINPDGTPKTQQNNGLYFRDYLTKKDKYSTFLGPNQPVVNITTDVKNNKKILVIKDSYANSFVPFLANHYSEITMLDLRYVQTSYTDIIDMDKYTQVLFLYNASTLSTDGNIKKLTYDF